MRLNRQLTPGDLEKVVNATNGRDYVRATHKCKDECTRNGQTCTIRASVSQEDQIFNGEIMCKVCKVEMTRLNLSSLLDQRWVNDEPLNIVMSMLNDRDKREYEKRKGEYGKRKGKYENQKNATTCDQDERSAPMRRVWCVNSFFMSKLDPDGGYTEHGYGTVHNWSKKAKLSGTNSIFDLWRMVIPVNIDNQHWTSVHVDFINKKCLYYDSMGGRGTKYLHLVMKYLKDEHLEKLGKRLDEGKWTISSSGRSIPQQTNFYDCGMFTGTYATFATDTCVHGQDNDRVLGLPLQFSQRDMLYLRNRLALDILNGNID